MISDAKIPDESDWVGCDTDPDLGYLRELFFGKSNAEVQEYFGDRCSIQRMDQLLSAPRAVFQYYVHAFAAFVMSEHAAGDAHSASPFLKLLEAREARDPGSVKAIYQSLVECVEFVASHQAHFDAHVAIHGDFKERAKRIHEICCA